MTPLTIAFGHALREIRKAANLTLEQLAERADMDSTSISLIERAKRSPTLRSLDKLKLALGISATEMVALAEKFLAHNPHATASMGSERREVSA